MAGEQVAASVLASKRDWGRGSTGARPTCWPATALVDSAARASPEEAPLRTATPLGAAPPLATFDETLLAALRMRPPRGGSSPHAVSDLARGLELHTGRHPIPLRADAGRRDEGMLT